MKKIIYLLCFFCGMMISVNGQPSTDLNTYLYDDFSNTALCPVFQAHHGTPHDVPGFMMWHVLFREGLVCAGQKKNLGEGIYADFNFVQGASYDINVNVNSFILGDNKTGRINVLLVKKPPLITLPCIGNPTPSRAEPIPVYSAADHIVLSNIQHVQDLTSSLNINIKLTSPDNFSAIVIYPEDLDPRCYSSSVSGVNGDEPVILTLNCVDIKLQCYGINNKTFAQTIPSGLDGARNYFIGSGFGSGPLAENTHGSNTDYRATNSILLEPNTLISHQTNGNSFSDFFQARIYPCINNNGSYPFPAEQSISPEEGCSNIATILDNNEWGSDPIDLEGDYPIIADPPEYLEGEEPNGQVVEGDEQSRRPQKKNNSLLHKEFKIYPNPTQGNINISLPSENCSIEIFNSYGQNLVKKKCSSQFENIEMSNFAAGIYMVRIYDEGNVLIGQKKVLKK